DGGGTRHGGVGGRDEAVHGPVEGSECQRAGTGEGRAGGRVAVGVAAVLEADGESVRCPGGEAWVHAERHRDQQIGQGPILKLLDGQRAAGLGPLAALAPLATATGTIRKESAKPIVEGHGSYLAAGKSGKHTARYRLPLGSVLP